jgi:hypothetical protein
VSFVAEHLVAALRARLPAAAGPELDAYEDRARTLDGDRHSELRRAYACARWAVDVAAAPTRSALAGVAVRAGEAVREIGKTVWAELGADIENVVARLFPGKTGAAYLGMWVGVNDPEQAPGTGASPLVGPEMAWVLEAVEVAEKAAEVEGWDAVPWRRLLDDVLSD